MLRLIARLNVGGPARHAVILDAGLRRLGVNTMLTFGPVGPAEGSLESLATGRGIPVRRIEQLGRRITPWDDLRAFAAIVQLLRRWRPDVLHTHTAKAGTLGRVAAMLHNCTLPRKRRCAVVHTFHGHVFTGYFGRWGTLAVRLVERALARTSDRIVAISERQREDLTRRYRVATPEQVVVIPLGLELEALFRLNRRSASDAAPLRGSLNLRQDDFVVGYVGRLVPIKDVDTLLRAVALVRSQEPSVHLIVVGDGECRDELARLAGRLGLAGAVHFLGWRSDLPEVYDAFDLFALTSRNEGTPVALIEAMAAGVPALATAVGGVPDVIEHGVTGTVVPPDRPDLVAAAIMEIRRDPPRAAAMAVAARSAARRRYGPDRLVADVHALYHEAIDSRRRPHGAAAQGRRS